VLLATASCNDESTSNNNTSGTAYCKPCSASSECASGNVCKQVAGSIGVCAKTSDTSCCDGPNGVGGNCHPGLGPELGAGGGGILGSGGASGRGGSGGAGGHATAGTGGTGITSSGNLGSACVTTTDCADSRLTCITPSGLNGDGPAKGICTLACNAAANNSDCLEIADNSYCAQFVDGNNYCVEGCTEGDMVKCHSRDQVACSLIGLIPGTSKCTASTDCATNELCDTQLGVCGQIVTGCMPTCGGDYDCDPGQHCDFSSGFCMAQKPAGLPLGSACTVATGNQTDPCNGICLPGSSADQTKGWCSGFCTFNPSATGCGWSGMGAADNACLFATVLSTSGMVAPNDVGLCGQICDCNADCVVPGNYCMDETANGAIMQVFGRNGYCRPLDTTTGEKPSDSFSQCSSSGTGGASSTGGSSNTGEAGQSGATSEAGAGGQGHK
jgi:hypothetical protein